MPLNQSNFMDGYHKRIQLKKRLNEATGYNGSVNSEELTDGIFYLFTHSTKHTLADVLAENGDLIIELMAQPYAQMKED